MEMGFFYAHELRPGEQLEVQQDNCRPQGDHSVFAAIHTRHEDREGCHMTDAYVKECQVPLEKHENVSDVIAV